MCLDLGKPYMGVRRPEGRQFDTDGSGDDSIAFCRRQVLFTGGHVELDNVRVTNCREEDNLA